MCTRVISVLFPFRNFFQSRMFHVSRLGSCNVKALLDNHTLTVIAIDGMSVLTGCWKEEFIVRRERSLYPKKSKRIVFLVQCLPKKKLMRIHLLLS